MGVRCVNSHAILFRFFGQSNCETDALRKERGERAEHLGNFCGTAENSMQKSATAVYDVQAQTRAVLLGQRLPRCTPYGLSDAIGRIFGNGRPAAIRRRLSLPQMAENNLESSQVSLK
jgi:hypothetical protein